MGRSTASHRGVSLGLLCVMGAAFLTAGCGQERTKGLFTLAQLKSYERLAVLGLTAEQEQVFMASYIGVFKDQPTTFVERARLRDIVGEQDLLRIPRDRLDDKTRAKMKQILGVEALVLCAFEEGDQGRGPKKLLVRIVDTETGAIVGSVITEARGDFESHCEQAVKALKQNLYKGARPDDRTPEPAAPRVVG
ncbi:MAG: hypothetical protein KBE04_03115 [Phycisphaerae bacterium]|nr:hypothetical protein [Phycisphaerae bacterium]